MAVVRHREGTGGDVKDSAVTVPRTHNPAQSLPQDHGQGAHPFPLPVTACALPTPQPIHKPTLSHPQPLGPDQVDKIVGRGAPEELLVQLRRVAGGHHEQLEVDCLRAFHFGPKFIVEVGHGCGSSEVGCGCGFFVPLMGRRGLGSGWSCFGPKFIVEGVCTSRSGVRGSHMACATTELVDAHDQGQGHKFLTELMKGPVKEGVPVMTCVQVEVVMPVYYTLKEVRAGQDLCIYHD